MTIPVYSADDLVGKDYQCSCVLKGEKHPFCENCLLLIGPTHVEEARMAALLPIYEDHFDDEQGVWYRGIHRVPRYVCASCKQAIDANPFAATLRIGRKLKRSVRMARDEQWRTDHPDKTPPTHVGEFLRVGSYNPEV